MKKLIFLFLTVSVLLISSISVFADTNVDGGGGSMGQGSGGNIWSPGDDGVRVTVIRTSDNRPVSKSLNFTNLQSQVVDFHGGLTSKIGYNSGKKFKLQIGSNFSARNITLAPLPQVIGLGGSNIPAIKSYFSDESIVKYICNEIGFNYDNLLGGKYKLLIEPMAYFKYMGDMYALTAQEASYLNQLEKGLLRKAMGNLTSKNLPLSMFLEVSDLGIPKWEGTRTGFVSDYEIQTYLGCAIVDFGEAEPPKPPRPTDGFIYRTNTKVFTSVKIKNTTGSNISPKENAKVTIDIGGMVHQEKSYVIPKDKETLVWVEWTTPSEEMVLPITITVTHGTAEYTTSKAYIEKLKETPPPDPKGTDVRPGYNIPNKPTSVSVTSLTWGDWTAERKEEIIQVEVADCAVYCDKFCKLQNGCEKDCKLKHYREEKVEWYEYTYNEYSASLNVKTDLTPAKTCNTAYKSNGDWIMKSGYGVEFDVYSNVYGNGEKTKVQNVISFFPEFGYKTYNRFLEEYKPQHYRFKDNNWSFAGGNIHYTPVWYPRQRNNYEPIVVVFDVWTPAGQLYSWKSGNVLIEDSCFDDWNVAPVPKNE